MQQSYFLPYQKINICVHLQWSMPCPPQLAYLVCLWVILCYLPVTALCLPQHREGLGQDTGDHPQLTPRVAGDPAVMVGTGAEVGLQVVGQGQAQGHADIGGKDGETTPGVTEAGVVTEAVVIRTSDHGGLGARVLWVRSRRRRRSHVTSRR